MPLVAREHHDSLEDAVIRLSKQVAHEVHDFTGLYRFADVPGIRVFLRVPQRRVDCPRTDGGDLDIVRNQFLAEGIGKAHHPVFGGTVARLSGDSPHPHHGARSVPPRVQNNLPGRFPGGIWDAGGWLRCYGGKR